MLNQAARLDIAFQALADPTRRAMVERLSRGQASVSALAQPLAMSLPAVLQHLQVLETSGLIRTEKVGRVRTCRIELAALQTVAQWITERRTTWERRLDRLGDLLDAQDDNPTQGVNMSDTANKRSATHATFVIERSYAAAPTRVFDAWSQPEAKARWFVGPDGWEKSDHTLDFRVGGREHVSGGPPGGPVHSYDAMYQDIVPNERIVSTYDMHMDDKRISVSLVTLEFTLEETPVGAGTRLIYTEQGVFLDGYDNVADREHGTHDLLDNLEAALRNG